MIKTLFIISALASSAIAEDLSKQTSIEQVTKERDALKAQLTTEEKQLAIYRQLLSEANDRLAAALGK